MGNAESMENHLINLKLSAKSLMRESKKCESSAAANKIKCKKAMEVGNMDGARIYAESAIRDKNQSLNYLRLASRIDAISQRVNTAVKMKTLTKDMSGIVQSMESVIQTMNVDKISAVMDKFERQFENLDLATGVMEQSMVQSTSQVMPEQQIEQLMQAVAEENGLEFESNLATVPNKAVVKSTAARKTEEDKKTELVGVSTANKAAAPSTASTDTSSSAAGGGKPVIDTAESLEERLRRLQGL